MTVSLFVDKDDNFSVKIWVAGSKAKASFVYCDISEEQIKKIAGEDIADNSLEEYEIWFRLPTYGDANSILDSSINIEESSVKVNVSNLRYERMASLIERWTFKDKNGNTLKPTRDAIKRLHPLVATMIGLQLESELQSRGVL